MFRPVQAKTVDSDENRTATAPIGHSSKSTLRSPGSRNIGDVSDPQMMNCPARKPAPTAHVGHLDPGQ
jgi:hypothetical protein